MLCEIGALRGYLMSDTDGMGKIYQSKLLVGDFGGRYKYSESIQLVIALLFCTDVGYI